MHELAEHRPAPARDPARPRARAGRRSTSTTSPARRPPPAPSSPPALSRPAHASAHTDLSAVGHAHIDTAWLWPLRETVRKTARTFANVTALAEEYPEFVFACSQAQQYAWVKEHHPEIYRRMQDAVEGGPVGAGRRACGSRPTATCPAARRWPASSCHGKRFFLDEFGVDCQGVWLPDSFGYTAAYPQLARLAGMRLVPHPEDLLEPDQPVPAPHVLVGGHRRQPDLHPLPAGRHLQRDAVRRGAGARGAQLRREGRAARRSLLPFGHGDGGGGPTREMLERARRLARPGGLAAGGDRAPRRVLRRGPSRSTRTPRSGPASSTSSCTAAPSPPRPAPRRATGAASTCCARPSCGRRPRRRAAPGATYPYERARPAVEDGAAAPVPRHPAGHLDRLGAPRGRGDLRRGRRRAGGDHRRGGVARWSAPASGPGCSNTAPVRAGPRWSRTPAGVAARYARGSRVGRSARLVEPDGRRAPPVTVVRPRARQRPGAGRVAGRGRLPGVGAGPGRRPRGAAPGGRATCCSCTPTCPTSGTPGTSTGTTGAAAPTWSTRRRSRSSRPARCVGAVRVERALRRLADRRRRCRCGPAASGSTSRPRSTGTSARRSSRRRSRSTCTPTARAAEIQFGHVHRPTHTNTSWDAARFEVCGAPLGARRRAGLRRRA